ncbi:MAG: DivIVA domain-containing protein [Fibrobacteres bacterium]|nr:DivIVA domain-containing protein [Fibrobacterota bacterium]MBK9576409.1 DivIVA domain-containing protein [Fibrobacterota bacterium]QQS05450.1 MAG: DivIVA domain-containing protein [Fibrobacterota bacterium]
MNITPLDIRKQEFNRKMRGYDPEEVQGFLDQVATALEASNAMVAELEERLKESESRLGHYRLIEQNLQDAALTVQRSLDETKRLAEKEAELIVREAHSRAEREAESLKDRVVRLQTDIATLEMQRANFLVRLKAVVRSQGDLIEAMELEASLGKAAPNRDEY